MRPQLTEKLTLGLSLSCKLELGLLQRAEVGSKLMLLAVKMARLLSLQGQNSIGGISKAQFPPQFQEEFTITLYNISDFGHTSVWRQSLKRWRFMGKVYSHLYTGSGLTGVLLCGGVASNMQTVWGAL